MLLEVLAATQLQECRALPVSILSKWSLISLQTAGMLPQKCMLPGLFSCNLSNHHPILIIFGRNLIGNWATNGWFIFPPLHYLAKHRNTELASFHSNALITALPDINQSLLDFCNLVDSRHTHAAV